MTQILTLKETAKFLRVHPTTMNRLIKKRLIPSFRVGSEHRFVLDVLVEWMNAESAAWVEVEKRKRDKGGLE